MTRRRTRTQNRVGAIALVCLLLAGLVCGVMLVRWSVVEIHELMEQREQAKQPKPLPYEQLVFQYCEEYAVDPLFVYAMMKQESGFDPQAVSVDNARGLLQLTEDTYNWVKSKLHEKGSFDDMFDPETNIRYGVWLTSYLFDRFGNAETVVTAYHAGLNITAKWLTDSRYTDNGETLKEIPYSDTRYHVKKVMRYYEEYKERYRSEEK